MRTVIVPVIVGVLAIALLASIPASAQEPCKTKQLKLSEGAPDAGAGHFAHAFQVMNSSDMSCTLEGVARLRLMDRRQNVVDAPVCAGCGDYLFGAKPVKIVVLQPGDSANFLLGAFHGNVTKEPCHTFARVQVQLASGGRPLDFRFNGGNVATCNLNESAWQAGLYSEDEDPPGPAGSQLLPFLHAHDVVLFQGDSITDGGRQRTGSDYNHIMGQDYGYIVAAEIGAESPERELVFVNRGISGNRVPDLETRWQADTISLHPQLLSILIGVNDLLSTGDRAVTLEAYEAGYDNLLAETVAALPGTKIVLCEPFLLPVGKQIAAYAENMAELKKRQAAVDRLGAKYHLPVVKYQAAFDAAMKKAPAEHWSWDGVHPTYAGHGLMAGEWLKTVDGFWRK